MSQLSAALEKTARSHLGIFILDCGFDIIGRYEMDRGKQDNTMIFGNFPRLHGELRIELPPQFENGVVPEDLLSNKYGPLLFLGSARAPRHSND